MPGFSFCCFSCSLCIFFFLLILKNGPLCMFGWSESELMWSWGWKFKAALMAKSMAVEIRQSGWVLWRPEEHIFLKIWGGKVSPFFPLPLHYIKLVALQSYPSGCSFCSCPWTGQSRSRGVHVWHRRPMVGKKPLTNLEGKGFIWLLKGKNSWFLHL